ncbi:MAG: lipoyl protein ligase domain-containing protein [Thermoproteota archaeon]
MQEKNLMVIRRSQGGGATYLDSNQIFYQVVARKDSKVMPSGIQELFEKLLSVTVSVYRKLGLQAEYKAINDVVVRGRKISGNGAGAFGKDTTILVGNIILDLDYDSMSSVLKVPDEKFRDKMAKSMMEWVTSINRELGYIPSSERIKALLVEAYESTLGIKLVRAKPSHEEIKIWEKQVKPRHLSGEWLNMPEIRYEVLIGRREVKIAEGIKVVELAHKAKKLIRVRAELVCDELREIMISGDFFMIPEAALHDLESSLRGTKMDRDSILKIVFDFYKRSGVQTPGVKPEDFVDAIVKLVEVQKNG